MFTLDHVLCTSQVELWLSLNQLPVCKASQEIFNEMIIDPGAPNQICFITDTEFTLNYILDFHLPHRFPESQESTYHHPPGSCPWLFLTHFCLFSITLLLLLCYTGALFSGSGSHLPPSWSRFSVQLTTLIFCPFPAPHFSPIVLSREIACP